MLFLFLNAVIRMHLLLVRLLLLKLLNLIDVRCPLDVFNVSEALSSLAVALRLVVVALAHRAKDMVVTSSNPGLTPDIGCYSCAPSLVP